MSIVVRVSIATKKNCTIDTESYLPNFSSSKSDGDLLGLRQSIEKIPILTVIQHRKSIIISKSRTPATAIDTIATDEMLILLSARPTATSKPGIMKIEMIGWKIKLIKTIYEKIKFQTKNITNACMRN